MFFNVGHVIGHKYRIIDQIGEGGFGEVYKAEDIKSGNPIALKCVLPQNFEDIPGFVDDFNREATAAQKISNDHVVKIYSIEKTEFRNRVIPFFTMEYAPDGDLDAYIRRQESFLSTDQLTAWMRQLLLGLQSVNAVIIHRDIKPKNILLFGDVLKISDFGICKFIEQSTRTMTFKGYGTPSYMAPEVWENISATPKVDMYSMGMVFYVLTTLKHPFLPVPAGALPSDYLKNKHLYEIPKKPTEINGGLPDKLSLMIMKMIDKKPQNRFRDANEILAFLDKAEASETKPSIAPGIKEIAGLLHKTEEKAKRAEIEKDQLIKRGREKVEKFAKAFIFSCEDLLRQYDKIIDDVNAEASTVKIEKQLARLDQRYIQTYSYHNKSIQMLLERTDAITQIPNIIGWGYCYIDRYQDGFNLLLQLVPEEAYPRWLITRTQDHPLLETSEHVQRHAMMDVSSLDEALKGLHSIHIYQTEQKPFSLDDFVALVKKLASG